MDGETMGGSGREALKLGEAEPGHPAWVCLGRACCGTRSSALASSPVTLDLKNNVPAEETFGITTVLHGRY